MELDESMLRGLARSASKAGFLGRSGLLRSMADRARDEKRWTDAAAFYRSYLELRQTDWAMWVQFGHALKESGRPNEAEAAYRHSLMLHPNSADTHLQLGHVLKMLGRMDEASLAYGRSAELDPANSHARAELDGLTGSGISSDPLQRILKSPIKVSLDQNGAHSVEGKDGLLDGEALAINGRDDITQDGDYAPSSPAEATGPSVVFDISDLLSYFKNARLPTGIQRVQIEIISALLHASQDASKEIGICAFAERRDRWVEIPDALFLKACDLSLSGGNGSEAAWVATVGEIMTILRRARPMRFAKGATIVNLGTSWWLQNYFLNVRNAKQECDVRYVPFVHDLIPVITPEHCVRELTEDFVTWILGVFDHADHFLVNSEATRADLMTVAKRLGHNLPADAVTVVRLDGDFRKSQPPRLQQPHGLRKWNLKPDGFVLFVGTIESRKNHLGAFSAWLALMRKHGASKIPKLVCVGNEGWLNGAVYAELKASETLRSRVVMLQALSDDELALLYDHCLFTLYPSHYEGWGLPVTESLCHGKIPLVSTTPALRESGGQFAEYFEAGSTPAMVAAIERLVFDDKFRFGRQKQIRDAFRPRGWLEIGQQVQRATSCEVPTVPHNDANHAIMRADLAVFYPAKRNSEARIWSNMKAGEMFRMGWRWWAPEDWGVWTKPGGAELAFRIAGPHRRLRGYFGLNGMHRSESSFSLEFGSPPSGSPLNGKIAAKEKKWVSCELGENDQDTIVRVVLRGEKQQDMATLSGGADGRLTSIGFRGFYVCEAEDSVARADFLEAMLLDEFVRLESGAKARGD